MRSRGESVSHRDKTTGKSERWTHRVTHVLGHSHDHGERVDEALETSERGIRTLKVSLVGLGATAALQLVVVVISGSVALLGDTMHNFSDALTSVPLWIAFNVGRRSRNARYTYGYGKAEDLTGLFIVAAIAVSAAFTAYEAVQRLLQPQPVHNLPLVIMAGLIGFAGNEVVAVYRIRTGREIGSAALVADGLHSRTDGLTSLAVVLGAIGVALGMEVADPLAGLGITVSLLFVLRGAARDVFRRLLDAVDPALVGEVTRAIEPIPGVKTIDDVRMRWIGHELRGEVEVTIDSNATLRDAHEVAVDVEHRLLHRVPRLRAVTVHVNPEPVEAWDPHEKLAHHRGRTSQSN